MIHLFVEVSYHDVLAIVCTFVLGTLSVITNSIALRMIWKQEQLVLVVRLYLVAEQLSRLLMTICAFYNLPASFVRFDPDPDDWYLNFDERITDYEFNQDDPLYPEVASMIGHCSSPTRRYS
ncbi:unnamed protein product, partial [Mesorhabditis spiculigera]